MPRLKYYNESTEQWEYVAVGGQGPQGEDGPGVPTGGTEGQILVKTDETDFSTQWADNSAESTFYLVRNNTGSTILKGTLVAATGAEPSGRVDVGPFETTGLQDSEIRVMGVATSNIANGVNGTVMSFGTLKGIDTRGTASSAIAVGDETWAEGDILYAHPTVPGKLTNVRPQHDLAVAFITVRHQSSGQIAVRIIPSNNHLEWLHDVEIDTAAAGDLIVRNSSNTLWENATLAEAGVSAVGHTHDDRYYTESETDTLLSGKANTSHVHAASDITSGTLAYDRLPAGTILQAVQTVYNSTATISNGSDSSYNSFTGLNTTITPRRANSKFLISYQLNIGSYGASVRAILLINGVASNTSGTGGQRASTNSIYGTGGLPTNASIYGFTGEFLFTNSGTNNVSISFEIFKQDPNYNVFVNRGHTYDDNARGRPTSTVTILEVAT